MSHIPFLDLTTPHLDLEDELITVFQEALRSGRFIGGPMVEDFEKDFANFCNTRFCIGVGSGTDALRFALIAAGVRPGDTVITVPNTFIATTEAITQVSALPEFVDINEQTYNIDYEKLREYIETRCYIDDGSGRPINHKTKSPITAILPVHLYGQMADMEPILDLAERYNLIVIEDACQAHGAEYLSRREDQWQKAGSMSKAGAFSFYPGKNLGACGEGGAITTNHEEIAYKVRMLRDHGQSSKYLHEIEGYNGRLDAIQAGILQIKLKYLPAWNESRRQKADLYNKLLEKVDGIIPPHEPKWAKPVYHLYIIRIRQRDALQHFLSERGITTGLHYPIPLHLQKAYKGLGYKEGDYPISERVAQEILSLPIYPYLTDDQQNQVVGNIREFVSEG
jgi:dTDP-4-amino-4,6-dideoxygalactose transaminase